MSNKVDPEKNTFWRHVEDYFHPITERDVELLKPDTVPSNDIPELGKNVRGSASSASSINLEGMNQYLDKGFISHEENSSSPEESFQFNSKNRGIFDIESIGNRFSNHLVQRLMSCFIEEIPPSSEKLDEIIVSLPLKAPVTPTKRNRKGRPSKKDGDINFKNYKNKMSSLIENAKTEIQDIKQFSSYHFSSENFEKMDSFLLNDLKNCGVFTSSENLHNVAVSHDKREDDEISAEIRNLQNKLKDLVIQTNEKKKFLKEKLLREKRKEDMREKETKANKIFLTKFLLEEELKKKPKK